MKNEDNDVPSIDQDTPSEPASLTEGPPAAKVEAHIASHAAMSQASNGEASIEDMQRLIATQRRRDANTCLDEIESVLKKHGFAIEASVTITGSKLPVARYGLVDIR